MPAAGVSGFAEIQEDAWCAVDALARFERRAVQSKQSGVFVGPPTRDNATAFMADAQDQWGVEALAGAFTEPAWKTKPSW